MTKMSQRDAVFAATMAVINEHDTIEFEAGEDISEFAADIRSDVSVIVCESFVNGKVEFKDTPSNAAKLKSPEKLRSYVSGLISNWYRKDKRFNGGTTYVAKNPGSRAGQGDAQLKALRAVHKNFIAQGETDRALVAEGHIKTRVDLLALERAKKTAVDLTAIPAELLEELGIELPTEEVEAELTA